MDRKFHTLSLATEGDLALPRRFTYPFHYTPHPLAVKAAGLVRKYVESRDDWAEELRQGKMLGVLVATDADGRTGYLAAFSGNLAGSNRHDFFVPPVFDLLQPHGEFKRGEAAITAINREIAQLEQSPRRTQFTERLTALRRERDETVNAYRRTMALHKAQRDRERSAGDLSPQRTEALLNQSRHEKAELKRLRRRHEERIDDALRERDAFEAGLLRLRNERKRMSEALQERIFHLFVMHNARGEQRDLVEIFKHTGAIPPAGAGECCAPRLLEYAYRHSLHPVCMAEFWWGDSPAGVVRHHGHFYPACRSKCKPILDFMLQGLDVEPNRLAQPVADEPLDVVYDDPWLSVVNKPAGMLSVPGKLLDDSLLSRYQAAHPEATGPIVVHRLDQETSGLVLFAKTKYVHKSLQSQFADHRIHKEYVALLSGAVKDDEGIIELPIRPDIDDRPRQRVDTTAGKRAVTRYRVLRRHAATTLVAFEPVTGRTHQLRVHASHPAGLGCPIVGDALYGQPDRRLFLHARQLSFTHPVTGQVVTARREESFTTAMTQQNRKQYHVVAAVIEHHRRILCMQRGLTRYSYTSYHWEFPGGKIEAGETPQQALHRELHEEMDYDVTVGPHLVTVTHSYPDFDITMEAYLCRAKTRRFTLREHHAYCWLTPEQLDTLPWCAADVPIQEAMSRRAHGL